MAKQYSSAPAMQIDPEKQYVAVMHTSKGDIKINLFAAQAPKTVNNFVFLARDGYYDNTTFHRVLPNFMVQGGDPTATGSGGPGYSFDDEQSALKLPHDGPGILSMANAGKNTNGSQFFITHKAQPHLNGGHAVFGKVADQASMDIVNSIRIRDPQRDSKPGDLLIAVDILES